MRSHTDWDTRGQSALCKGVVHSYDRFHPTNLQIRWRLLYWPKRAGVRNSIQIHRPRGWGSSRSLPAAWWVRRVHKTQITSTQQKVSQWVDSSSKRDWRYDMRHLMESNTTMKRFLDYQGVRLTTDHYHSSVPENTSQPSSAGTACYGHLGLLKQIRKRIIHHGLISCACIDKDLHVPTKFIPISFILMYSNPILFHCPEPVRSERVLHTRILLCWRNVLPPKSPKVKPKSGVDFWRGVSSLLKNEDGYAFQDEGVSINQWTRLSKKWKNPSLTHGGNIFVND